MNNINLNQQFYFQGFLDAKGITISCLLLVELPTSTLLKLVYLKSLQYFSTLDLAPIAKVAGAFWKIHKSDSCG